MADATPTGVVKPRRNSSYHDQMPPSPATATAGSTSPRGSRLAGCFKSSPLAASSSSSSSAEPTAPPTGYEIVAKRIDIYYDLYTVFLMAQMLRSLNTDDIVKNMFGAEDAAKAMATHFQLHPDQVWIVGIYLRIKQKVEEAAAVAAADLGDDDECEMVGEKRRYIGYAAIYVDVDALYMESCVVGIQWSRSMNYTTVKEEALSAVRVWYASQRDHSRLLHSVLPFEKNYLLNLEDASTTLEMQARRAEIKQQVDTYKRMLQQRRESNSGMPSAANPVVLPSLVAFSASLPTVPQPAVPTHPLVSPRAPQTQSPRVSQAHATEGPA